MTNVLPGRATTAAVITADRLFGGPGEMRARCRAHDWAATSLGPVETWPTSLRTTVATLMASAHPMFLWWGPQLIQIYNDAYRPSFGEHGRHPDALGMRGADCWTDIWNIIGPEIAGVMTTGEATWHDDAYIPILRNDQLEDVWWSYGYNPVYDDERTIAGTLVICHESTQRVHAGRAQAQRFEAEHAASAALTRIFAQAPVAIAVLTGPEFRYTFANPRYQLIVGGRDPVGKTLIEMFPELAGSDIHSVLEGVYDTGVPFSANDLLIEFDAHGTGVQANFYDLVYQPLMGDDGHVTGIVAVAVEVTERVHMIAERDRLLGEADQARADAEAANRAKSEFLAVMSHELRTPLNAIDGYAELMELGIHGPITDEQRQDLARIRKSEKHLLGLINGVLSYAQVEAGAVHYELEPVPLDEVLRTCEALVAPQVRANAIVLRRQPCDSALTVRADCEKLQQVVLNLLSNALKFTEAGGRIELRWVLTRDPRGPVVQVKVADTGIGIASAHLVRIFEPFVQVDSELTRTREGTGLGLAISRDLARGMGGDLTVESTLGAGSTFTLTLGAEQPAR
jgi:signal transduction histidine kinase